jgi:membrane protease YdiL (CAAX protease family)
LLEFRGVLKRHGSNPVDSLTHFQVTILAIEGVLLAAGVLAWIIRPRRPAPRTLSWDVPVTDTLFLAWALLFGGFLGQLTGLLILRMLPDAMSANEAVRIIVVGSCFDFGCIAAWFGVHRFMHGKGEPLPPVSESRLRTSTTLIESGLVFLRALPVIALVGLAAGFALRSLGIPVEEQDIVSVFARTDSLFALAGMLVLAVVIAPLTEELVFRAGLFRVLANYIGRWPAIAISSTVFAGLHLSWAGFAPLFCLGVIFCLAYARTGNIAVPMIAHGLFNLNSVLWILVLPAELFQ